MSERYAPILKDRVKNSLKDLASPKTQIDLAEYLGIAPRSVNRYLQKGRCERKYLLKNAKFLDCSPEYLTGEKNAKGYFSSPDHNINECIRDLLILRGYHPSVFTDEDMNSLYLELSTTIARFIGSNAYKGLF